MEENDEDRLSELYAAYCEFKHDATRSMLGSISDDQLRTAVQQINRPMPKEEFFSRASALQSDEKQYSRLKAILSAGWKQSSGTRAR